MMFDSLGYYEILNIDFDADERIIKQNYRDLAKIWHPDNNKSSDAIENFQRLSIAYETLKDDEKRMMYDLLSLAFIENNFPDIKEIKPYVSLNGIEDVNLRRINLVKIIGQVWKYKKNKETIICTRKEALSLEIKTSLLNWLLGWWNPKSFLETPSALVFNFKNIYSKKENLALFVHNSVAYYQNENKSAAVQSAILALDHANPEQRKILQKFIMTLNIRVNHIAKWNLRSLKLAQLIFPSILIILLLIPYSAKYVSETDLMNIFAKNKEITYFQQVKFKDQSETVDDVIVGKILSVPIDIYDATYLYHLKNESNIMHGPSKSFDILKKMLTSTTVRVTGITPDDIWFRVMIDNGETGFILVEELNKGIGKKIPDYSEIYKSN